jgi:phosphoribosylglycinamide formyltransferase-1
MERRCRDNMSFDTRAAIGVLASGRGSNFATLLQKQNDAFFGNASLACLVSNRPTAPALDTARNGGVPAFAVKPKDFDSAEAYEAEIVRLFDEHRVNLLVLAGYMKIVGSTILDRYEGRIVNIHPSLLPSFPGLHAQQQAVNHGVRFSGCTVHFVDAGLDSGPIIGQRVVPVLPDDTEDSLSARILIQEHELFPRCVRAITERPWRIDGRRVVFLDGDAEPL